MEIRGVTTSGHYVVGGVFSLYDTRGLPLDVVLDTLKERNIVPDWPLFCMDALRAGWKPSTIKTRIADAVADVYGHTYCAEVQKRLNALLKQA